MSMLLCALFPFVFEVCSLDGASNCYYCSVVSYLKKRKLLCPVCSVSHQCHFFFLCVYVKGGESAQEAEAVRASPRGSPPDHALASAAEEGDLRLPGVVGGGQHPGPAEAGGAVVAAAGPPPGRGRLRRRGVPRRGGGAAGARARGARRLLRVLRGRHDHGGGAADVPDHAEHARRRRAGRDRRQRHQLGRLDPGVDRRGEPPRRPHEQVPVPLRQGRHEAGREDDTVPHRFGNGPQDGFEPVHGLHLHVVPGARHLHLARQHGPPRQAVRRRQAGADLRHHRRRREAPRGGVRAHRRQALRGRPRLHGARLRRHDAQEGGHAGAPHVRRRRRQALRALQRRRAEARRVHGQGLRRHPRVPRTPVGGRGPRRAVRRRAPRAGLRVLARAQIQEARGESGAAGQGPGVRAVQLDLWAPSSAPLTEKFSHTAH